MKERDLGAEGRIMSHSKVWKLNEFSAHSANVNAVSLGRKSGRVFATGGEDKKVNLWAVGKPNCIMSLTGHSTSIDCVKFSITEEHVCAGSQAGALKIWDLEQAKVIRTLVGHRASIRCVDFHTFGDFLASGSSDSGIKMWDIRRKGCIFGYKGHNSTVNSLSFSPDGQWIASGGDDNYVKVWDIRVGKVLAQFHDHVDSVSDIAFHPAEFLLASGSCDKTVKFWDLESFTMVSSSDIDVAAIRCISFDSDGSVLYTASSESLRVHRWEPSDVNTIPATWSSRIQDIVVLNDQLIGVASHLTNVSVFVADTRHMKSGQNINSNEMSDEIRIGHPRRNFNIVKCSDMAETLAGLGLPRTEPERASEGTENVLTFSDLFQAFHARKDLSRTPPPCENYSVTEMNLPAMPQELAECNENLGKSMDSNSRMFNDGLEMNAVECNASHRHLELDDQNYIHAESNCCTITKRQTASSEEESMSTSGNKLKEDSRTNQNVNIQEMQGRKKPPKSSEKSPAQCQVKPMLKSSTENRVLQKVELSVNDEYIPFSFNTPAGFSIRDFLPESNQPLDKGTNAVLEVNESHVFSMLFREHHSILTALLTRHRNLCTIYNVWRTNSARSAVETATLLRDVTAIVDIFCVLVHKPSIWSLDLCIVVLPSVLPLLQSKYESYVLIGCNILHLILRNFSTIIKTNIDSPIQTVGVDITREERFNKSVECYRHLVEIRAFTLKRQTLQGKIGNSFRELHNVLATLD